MNLGLDYMAIIKALFTRSLLYSLSYISTRIVKVQLNGKCKLLHKKATINKHSTS